MRRFITLAILICTAITAAAALPGLGQLSPDQEALAKIFDTYISSQNANDAETFLTLWDEEGVKMSYNTPMLVGKTAIASSIRTSFNTYYKAMWIEIQEIVTSGDYGFSRGLFGVVLTPKNGGTPKNVDGKYLTIFRRTIDGKWLIYRDITNSNVKTQ